MEHCTAARVKRTAMQLMRFIVVIVGAASSGIALGTFSRHNGMRNVNSDATQKLNSRTTNNDTFGAPLNYVADLSLAVKQRSQNLRALAAGISDFVPLGCNLSMQDPCELWSNMPSEYLSTSGKLRIPCGSCVTVDITDGSTVQFPNGMDIVGKLVIPTEARVTFEIGNLIVQGEVDFKSDELVGGEAKVKFVMTGSTDHTFIPHGENEDACGGSGIPCNVGSKAIVVAGGKLNIRGMPEGCPSWTYLEDTEEADMPTSDNVAAAWTLPEECGEGGVLLHETFSGGTNGWTGNLGAMTTVTNTDSWDGGESFYLKVTNRLKSWQGPYFDLGPIQNCLTAGTAFFVTFRMRLSGKSSNNCATSGEDCPKIRISYMTSTDQLVWNTLVTLRPDEVSSIDGEWKSVSTMVSFTEAQIAATNVYAALSFEGPEANVDVSLGDVKIALPQADVAASDPATVCARLLSNRDASSGFTFPFYSFVKNEATLSVMNDGGADRGDYFHLTGRTQLYSTISATLNTDCTQVGVTYAFRANIWSHSPVSTTYRAILKTYAQDDTATTQMIANCPPSSETIGWVECSNNAFTFEQVHQDASKIELMIVNIESDDSSDISFDDIAFDFVRSGYGIPIVGADAASCWSVGAELLFPSDTLSYVDARVRTVSEIDGTTGKLTTEGGPFPLADSVAKSPDFAGEVGLLSRNIVFESVAGSGESGGHLLIFHTPGVVQVLEGVAFLGFGQKGVADRFPVNFHMSGNVSGSVVKKNVIRNSSQRCVNIRGTDGILVAENVAYNNFGHCFVLQDGAESSNILDKNLGSVTKAIPNAQLLQGGTDNTPATFYITSPTNTISNNVAAGSEDSGFWIHVQGTVAPGESAALHQGYDPSAQPLTTFVNNTAHSNGKHGVKVQKLCPGGNDFSVLQGTRSFRNLQYGLFLWQGQNIVVEGGKMSDNRIGIDVQYMSSISLSDIEVEGVSDLYLEAVRTRGARSHCYTYAVPPPVTGVRLHANPKDATLSGVTISTIAFRNIDSSKTGCPGSVAVTVNPQVAEPSFECKTAFSGLSFDVSVPISEKINLCNVESSGVQNVVIQDDGGLNPTGDGSSGVVMSDNDSILAFAGDCTEMAGACAHYCTGAATCMKQITVAVDPQATYNTQLHVSDDSGATTVVYGDFATVSPYVDTVWTKKRYYSFAVPSGRYSGTFIDLSDALVWPTYADISVDEPDGCTFGTDDTFTLNLPEKTAETCNDLIRNNGFDTGSGLSSGWSHIGGGLKFVSPGNGGTGNALSTETRTEWYHGPAVYLDTRCMTEGSSYKIEAKMRLWFTTGGYAPCLPGVKFGSLLCPRGSIKMLKGGHVTGYDWGAAYAVTQAAVDGKRPFEDAWENWNNFYGEFTVDSLMADADQVVFFIERLRNGVEIQIDDVHMVPFENTCSTDNLVKNGDFEGGNANYWTFLGSNTRLQVVAPGFNSAYALSTVVRDYWFWGQVQPLDPLCLIPGTLYEVTASVQLKNPDGSIHVCDPWKMYLGPGHCPSINIMVAKSGAENRWIEIGKTLGPTSAANGGWNPIYGVFEATADITNADTIDLYFAKAWSNIQMTIDGVVVAPAAPSVLSFFTCDDLIRNGQVSMNTLAFWNVMGNGKLDLFPLGGGNMAVRHTNRVVFWNGPRQFIDQNCLTLSSQWLVKASILLVDPDTNAGIQCDKSLDWGDNQCPGFIVYSLTPGENPATEHIVVRNELDGDWDADGFNEVQGTFDVTEAMLNLEQVSVFVSFTNKAWDIVIDNFSVVPALAI